MRHQLDHGAANVRDRLQILYLPQCLVQSIVRQRLQTTSAWFLNARQARVPTPRGQTLQRRLCVVGVIPLVSVPIDGVCKPARSPDDAAECSVQVPDAGRAWSRARPPVLAGRSWRQCRGRLRPASGSAQASHGEMPRLSGFGRRPSGLRQVRMGPRSLVRSSLHISTTAQPTIMRQRRRANVAHRTARLRSYPQTQGLRSVCAGAHKVLQPNTSSMFGASGQMGVASSKVLGPAQLPARPLDDAARTRLAERSMHGRPVPTPRPRMV